MIFSEADMAGTGRVHASPAQPRQLTSARAFALVQIECLEKANRIK
jgi:hypothetical protein